jgi:hypothetical protein
MRSVLFIDTYRNENGEFDALFIEVVPVVLHEWLPSALP